MPWKAPLFTVRTDAELSPVSLVFDLPALHTRPPATVLLDVLNALAIKPPTFDGARHGEEPGPSRLRVDHSLARYLTGIISNQLGWIEKESLREEVWELASARLSERSGRSGMFNAFQVRRL